MPQDVPAAGALAGAEADDARMVQDVARKAAPFAELGVTGLKRSAGYVDEEFLPQLKGRKAVQVYREMADNDPIVGALLFAIVQLLRGVDWQVTPAGKSKEHADAAKLVETAMDDMSHSWDDMVVEALSSLTYGWSWHEIVYKRRMGPWQKDGRQRSKYSDGLIGWRKMPVRSQETLLRWVFDESGGVRAMVQLAPPNYRTTVLPIERSLLFRYGAAKGNPEGRSLLRNAYRPWYYKKRLEEFEGIGVERDLAGLPMVKVPAEYLRARPGTEQAKMVDAFRKMVRSVRRDEQEGLVFPQQYDQETRQPLFDFELLGSGGTRAFSTNELIQRYEQRILMTVLADWIMVGHTRVGSYNLHLDKTGIFREALNATAKSIADVINRHAIPRLFAVNGWKPAELPTLVPQDVDAPDIAQLAQFLTATAGLGFTWGPDADMERYLREAAGLPELREDDYTAHRRQARREEAIRFADTETRYLAARSQLAQAHAEQQMQAAGEPLPEAAQAMAAQQQQDQQGQVDQQRAQEQHDMQMQTGKLSQLAQLQQMLGGGGPSADGASGGRSNGRPVSRGTSRGGERR